MWEDEGFLAFVNIRYCSTSRTIQASLFYILCLQFHELAQNYRKAGLERDLLVWWGSENQRQGSYYDQILPFQLQQLVYRLRFHNFWFLETSKMLVLELRKYLYFQLLIALWINNSTLKMSETIPIWTFTYQPEVFVGQKP